jgi:hypothetical protein
MNNEPTPETTSTRAPETVPCSVCGGEIQKLPEFLYQFRNQTGNSVLFLQLMTSVPPKHPNQKAKFVPAPICLACSLKIIGNFVAGGKQEVAKIVIGDPQIETGVPPDGSPAKEPQSKPESN